MDSLVLTEKKDLINNMINLNKKKMEKILYKYNDMEITEENINIIFNYLNWVNIELDTLLNVELPDDQWEKTIKKFLPFMILDYMN